MSYLASAGVNGLKPEADCPYLRGGREVDVAGMAARLNFTDFLERDINAGSRREISDRARSAHGQQPDLLLFDEPESAWSSRTSP
jgi:Fe-S cluster assembly ATP-binding protein